MPNFVDLVTLLSGGITLVGIPLNYFLKNQAALQAEKNQVQAFIQALSTKDVLTARMADEVLPAVIKSLEDIVSEINTLISLTGSNEIIDIMNSLKLFINKNVRTMYTLDINDIKDFRKCYQLLQNIRKECATTLAFLCASFKIDPRNPSFEQYILTYKIQPK